MKKTILFSLIACMAGTTLQAQQSDTYPIETLTKPANLLKTVMPADQYNDVKDRLFVRVSDTGPVVNRGMHPVLIGFLNAYQEHRPITLSPDIVWLLICQGFSRHVNNNSEALRDQFVHFQGKQAIEIKRKVDSTTTLHTFPWESIFPEFTQRVNDAVGKNLTNTLTADFTTTTPASLITSQITIMEAMKNYFEYKVTMLGCGIPEVTLEGSVKDWQKILDKLKQLARYDLTWWTNELKPIIQEIIQTKQGKVDRKFWMQMIRFHEEGLYGAPYEIDGWFLKFYPYLKDGTRWNMKRLAKIDLLPSELVCVPFEFEVATNDGLSVQNLNMEFWAGFRGLKQNDQTFNLKPEIGWAICIAQEPIAKE